MGLSSNPVLWYTMRASGIVAYVLLSLVVYVGISLAGRKPRAWPRFAVEDVHRFGGVLVGTFVWIHVGTVAIDKYFPFSLADVLVPFHASFKPFWTAMGVVAAELLLALAITNKLRHRLPHRVWRAIHGLNFVVWLAAAAHGVESGTDSSSSWMLGVYLISIAAVTTALAARVLSGRPAVPAKGRLSEV